MKSMCFLVVLCIVSAFSMDQIDDKVFIFSNRKILTKDWVDSLPEIRKSSSLFIEQCDFDQEDFFHLSQLFFKKIVIKNSSMDGDGLEYLFANVRPENFDTLSLPNNVLGKDPERLIKILRSYVGDSGPFGFEKLDLSGNHCEFLEKEKSWINAKNIEL